jgi:hypothetical protein
MADSKKPPPTYAAGEARQGEIVLRTKPQRAVFVAGLALPFVIALIILLFILFKH